MSERRRQCKDILDGPLLGFVARKQSEKGMWVNTWDFEPPYSDLPDKLFRAKMDNLIRRGLLDGCPCGCRGDYELTEKGREFLANANLAQRPSPSGGGLLRCWHALAATTDMRHGKCL